MFKEELQTGIIKKKRNFLNESINFWLGYLHNNQNKKENASEIKNNNSSNGKKNKKTKILDVIV